MLLMRGLLRARRKRPRHRPATAPPPNSVMNTLSGKLVLHTKHGHQKGHCPLLWWNVTTTSPLDLVTSGRFVVTKVRRIFRTCGRVRLGLGKAKRVKCFAEFLPFHFSCPRSAVVPLSFEISLYASSGVEDPDARGVRPPSEGCRRENGERAAVIAAAATRPTRTLTRSAQAQPRALSVRRGRAVRRGASLTKTQWPNA